MSLNRKLNILFVSSDFSVPPFGGISSFLCGIGPQLVRRGHSVHVAVPRYGRGPEYHDNEGMHVHYIYHDGTTRFLRYFQLISFVRKKLSDFIKENSIDLVNVHDLLVGPPAAKALKGIVPVVFTNHTSVFAQWSENLFHRVILKRLIGRPDGIIAISPVLEKKSRMFSTSLLTHIPCGIHVEQFETAEEDASLLKKIGSDSESQFILYVGRFHPVKGLKYLLEALPAILDDIPQARLVIAGGGTPDEEKSIINQIEDLEISKQVILLGRVEHARLPGLYKSARCLALPSLMEGTSITALEAMTSKIPVVATSAGGTPQVVLDGKTGILVPPRDSDALAGAIVRMLNDEALSQIYGQAGYDRVKNHFSWSVIIDQTEQFFSSVIQKFQEDNR